MRKIAHKTALYISAVFLIILSGISIYLYNLQISLIDGLENQKKETILKFINEDAKKTLNEIIDDILQNGHSIQSAVSEALYNMDTQTQKQSIIPLLKNPYVKAVEIYDTSLNEISIVGTENPVIIALGNDVYKILKRNGILKKYKVVKITHYSAPLSCPIGEAGEYHKDRVMPVLVQALTCKSW